jgi:transcriptional regulator with XRE-family HTH domain
MLDRFESGAAFRVPAEEAEAAARRVLARYQERRREVSKLGPEIADYRRLFGITQEDVARAIGTSKPNICAIEKGRAPGITLERFLAIVEALKVGTRPAPMTTVVRTRGRLSLTPSEAVRSLAEALEAE